MTNASAETKNDAPKRQRERIYKTAARLFAENSYGAVGVAELCAATGFGKGALYYHIGSKEELLFEVMTRYMVDLVEEGRRAAAEDATPAERISTLSRKLVRSVFDHLPEMTVCFRELNSLGPQNRAVVSKLHLDYQRIWEAALADGVAAGVFRPISSVELKGLLGMYFYSFLWIKPKGPQGPDAIADRYAEIVLRAVAPS